MKHLWKKATAVLLSAVMLGSTGAVAATALTGETSAAGDSSYYYGAFYYRPGEGEISALSDSVDYYAYTDDYFKGDSRVYNEHLSTMSMSLAEASVSSTREAFTDEGYKHKNRDVIALLEDTGFSDITVNDDYTKKPTKDSVGVACAHKAIIDNGKAYTLLAIVPRSAGYEAEWGNNFVLGAGGDAQGFAGCADKCLAFAKEYIAANDLKGDLKVWTVGYSRGAAITDILARKLVDDPQAALGENTVLTSDNLYAYTFGTPSGADVANNPRDEKYACIFNSFSETELPAAMAPVDMGFARYGVDRVLMNDAKKEAMLQNLQICNASIYDQFVNTVSSYHFAPKKIGLKDGNIAIVNDDASYIPGDARTYLQGLAAYLTQVTGGRESYAATYEQPFSDFLAYYQSLTGERSSAFTSALLSGEDSIYLAVAMYAYFMKNKSADAVGGSMEQMIAKAEELAAVAAAEDEEGSGLDFTVIIKAGLALFSYLMMQPEEIKPIAADYLSKVVKNAMTVSGAAEEQINAVCNPEASEALVHLISHLLFGNTWQSSNVSPITLNNEQMKNVATLIGNFTNIMYDHANEIIISWLRVDDAYFADYKPLTEAQKDGYRRVYFTADDPAALNGVILDANGETAAVIKNGVLTNHTDKWIGFTNTDQGGFFRIPAGADYRVALENVAGSFSAAVSEYSVYDALAEEVFRDGFTAECADAVLTLSADGTYSLTKTEKTDFVMGDVDLDGVVTVCDVTVMQRALANFLTFSAIQAALADVSGDGSFTIEDVTCVQCYLAEFESADNLTGNPYVTV